MMMEEKKRARYTGLTDKEVEESRRKHGVNILTPKEKESLLKKFLYKFSDKLIVILLVAGALSLGISLYEFYKLGDGPEVFFEPLGIFIAIILATGLSFIFEMKADKEFSLLNKVNDEEPVKVIRNGATQEIPRKDVVVGDIVAVSTGDEIPADGTLLESTSLSVNESSLTGEPLCRKSTDKKLFDGNATYPTNRLLRGTNVMEGHALFVADTVGDQTENGKVFKEAQIDNSVKTPLNEQLENLSRFITKASYVLAALVIIGKTIAFFTATPDAAATLHESRHFVHFMAYSLNTLMIAVTLIVVAVPEGLPMAVTLSLAYSMRKMLKTNNLVRRMHACETMGATTVICTDKTGTLTKNQMSVSETEFYCNNSLAGIIAEGIAVNTTASVNNGHVIGNPTEGALLLWLGQQGYDYHKLRASAKRTAEIPFSTERKYMATAVYSERENKNLLYVKGAPEILLALCKDISGNTDRKDIERKLAEWQQKAMRTLGFAYQTIEEGEEVVRDGKLIATRLTFLGIAAISDPVRDEVPEAVAKCLEAGIGIKMVTGDTPGTAKEIGRETGIWTSLDSERNIITGPEFEKLNEQELAERIDEIKIISRARPLDKKRLVEALQQKGHVVAVTGDGTNDAPALNAAHVGLSMGGGTSVAKEASDITIIDNSFKSITRAVMWGRSLYKNIQRFILFQMTINVAACLIVLTGAFIGTENPITVTQMLWVNLIMDTFAAMALASLPPSSEVMREKPRKRSAFIISRSMSVQIATTGLAFTVVLVALLLLFKHIDITRLTDIGIHAAWQSTPHISRYELSVFFTTFVMLQFWNMFNARAFDTGHSVFSLQSGNGFTIIALLIVSGQIAIVTFGGDMFSVVPLHFSDWVVIVIATSPVLWCGEAIRFIQRKKQAVTVFQAMTERTHP